jgi:hypothetical protein
MITTTTSGYEADIDAMRRDMAITKRVLWFTAVGVLALLIKTFGETS